MTRLYSVLSVAEDLRKAAADGDIGGMRAAISLLDKKEEQTKKMIMTQALKSAMENNKVDSIQYLMSHGVKSSDVLNNRELIEKLDIANMRVASAERVISTIQELERQSRDYARNHGGSLEGIRPLIEFIRRPTVWC